ncbi:MAG: isocitrate/isopropylmalate dehydrogenase family protein [Anaerolineae bacterium]
MKLCVIPGDGIGKEVIPAAVQVLQSVLPELETVAAEAGWETFENTGHSVPPETLDQIQQCGAGLFGAVQSPLRKVEGYRSAILTMRQELGLYANIRPVVSIAGVTPSSEKQLDMIVVRENSEGLYIGRESSDGETAVAERIITRTASRRIAQRTVELAKAQNRRKITIVHKANVLPLTDGLFRDSVRAVIIESGLNIEVDELLIDVAALKMVGEPERFDLVVTTNLFGDILSDAAAHWGGGLGLAPSLNWGDSVAVAEPVHGSAPDIAGRGLANPIAAILSGAMLARYMWDRPEVADHIEQSVSAVMQAGLPAKNVTAKVTDAVLDVLRLGV